MMNGEEVQGCLVVVVVEEMSFFLVEIGGKMFYLRKKISIPFFRCKVEKIRNMMRVIFLLVGKVVL